MMNLFEFQTMGKMVEVNKGSISWCTWAGGDAGLLFAAIGAKAGPEEARGRASNMVCKKGHQNNLLTTHPFGE